jgi:hypothetical protein
MKYMLTVAVRVGADNPSPVRELGRMLEDVTEAVLLNTPGLDGYHLLGAQIGEANITTSFTTTVSEYGNSLAVNITRHADEIGVGKGDKVVVTVRRYA